MGKFCGQVGTRIGTSDAKGIEAQRGSAGSQFGDEFVCGVLGNTTALA